MCKAIIYKRFKYMLLLRKDNYLREINMADLQTILENNACVLYTIPVVGQITALVGAEPGKKISSALYVTLFQSVIWGGGSLLAYELYQATIYGRDLLLR